MTSRERVRAGLCCAGALAMLGCSNASDPVKLHTDVVASDIRVQPAQAVCLKRTTPVEPKDYYRQDRPPIRSTVLFVRDGQTSNFELEPETFAFAAYFRARRGQVVCLTVSGILAIDPQERSLNWVWRRGLLMSIHAIHPQRDLLAVIVSEETARGITRTLVLLRLDDYSSIEVPLPSVPYGMVFSEDALLLTIEGELFKVAPLSEDPGSSHLRKIREVDGDVVAQIQGRPVLLNQEGTVVRLADATIDLDNPASVVATSPSKIWILTEQGRVLEVDPEEPQPRVASRLDKGQILGSGANSSGLWVLLRDGTLHLFGDEATPREINLGGMAE